MLELKLGYQPPYDWPAVLNFLNTRKIPSVEVIEAGEYRRSIRLNGQFSLLTVKQDAAKCQLICSISPAPQEARINLTQKLRSMFDLDADPIQIKSVLSQESRLKPSIEEYPGLRIPGCWDGFETCVRAIIGQQISVAGAITIVGRLVERYGQTCDLGSGVAHAFPTALQLVENLVVEDMAMPRARAQALLLLSQACAPEGFIDFDLMEADELQVSLQKIKGIGPWTASYVALRAMNQADVMPVEDLVLQKTLEPGRRLSAKELTQRAEVWRPWRGYATLHLWHLANQK